MPRLTASSTANEVFVDTSGFYALLVRRDNRHSEAAAVLRRAGASGRRFVTTDYVLDESATLLKARGLARLCDALFDAALASRACRVEWTDTERFGRTRAYFRAHHDHGYSFTDCLCFVVMRELGLSQVLTKDGHFREAGFQALLL